MRGLSGNEQARVLVMIDGVPVNKSDGGSVNWNLLDPAIVERIEVVKGPASSMYGSNAMGGAINIITRRPSGALSGKVTAGYGTYNTFSGRVSLGQKLNPGEDRGFYYLLNGFYRQSDGYITQSEFDQAANPYVVASDMQEYSASLKTGYNFRKGEFLEADFIAYNDRRGTGELVWQPHGNTTDHDTWQFRTRYSLERDRLSADVSFFWLKEDYKKVNEYLKDDYTWYNVFSERLDAGSAFIGVMEGRQPAPVLRRHDLKAGSVDAADVYYTSTDIVYNRGRMLSSGLYLQDAFSIMP
jgi:iron complex outermembrane recepter protein